MTSKITLNATGLTTVAPDSYVWLNPYGGAWGTAGNWTDSTTGTTATAAPGAANAVSIAGGTIDFINITGSGAAASLAVANMVLLWGTVSVGGAVALAGNSDLELDGAAKLTAGSLALNATGNGTAQYSIFGSTLEVGNGSTLKVSGAALLAQQSFLLATGGSSVQLGSLVANGGGLYDSSGSLVAVDDTSSIEVGTAGGAALGAITIDKGQVSAISGTLDGNVVVGGTLAVQAGHGLIIDGYALSGSTSSGGGDPFGSATTISGAGTLVLSENSTLGLGVADSAAIQFAGPNGLLALNVLSTGTIGGFANGDSIELYGLATGMSVALTGTTLATLTFTKSGKAAGTLQLAGNYTGSQFHMSMDRSGDGFVTVQTAGGARTQPNLILGTVGADHLTATANNQTLTGLGGGDLLDGGGFTGVDFKDTSANLNGSTIQNASTTDIIDLTDMKLGTVSLNYVPGFYNPVNFQVVPGSLSVSDGSHAAVLKLSNTLPTGYFASSTDGGTGTDIKFVVIQTVATANNQTLTGLGIAETLDAGTFTGIDFKDTSAHLNGVTLNNFGTTDLIDLTDMALGKVSESYVPSYYNSTLGKYFPNTLTVGDGTHNAVLTLQNNLPLGVFLPAGDGGAGTDLTYKAVDTTATANNQTLYGLGVVTYLNALSYTGIDFKDSSANLHGTTLAGFVASDTIDLTDMNPASVTVGYVPDPYAANGGTLTVADGTHSATMTLYTSGSLAVGYFATSSDGAGGADLTYTVVNTDALSFSYALGGDYRLVGNWQDTTSASAATAAPSYGNAVTIAQLGAGYTDVTGSGAAASLTTSGDVLLWGSLTVGALVGGVSGALAQSGSLQLDGGASLSLTGTATVSGLLEVGGVSKLTGGAIAFGPTGGPALLAVGGSSIRFSNIVGYQQFFYAPSFYASTIGIDATSTIEIGSAGGAAKGALTVDSGITAELAGSLDGNVVVNGTLLGSGLTIAGFGGAAAAVTGAGTLEIVAGGTLTLAASDSAAILFYHGNSNYYDTLALNGALPTGAIGGFATGDAIALAKTITRVGYSQTTAATGTLTLFNGATTVGTLSLAGSYTAGQFQVSTSPGGAGGTISYSPTGSTAPGTQISSTTDTFVWNNSSGGVWSNAGNWTDNGATATAAPGAGNPVGISNYGVGAGAPVISGSGSAASLTINGNDIAFAGSVTVGGLLANYAGASIIIDAGASITAGSLSNYGTLAVAGGALTVGGGSAGTAYLQGAVVVSGGGRMQVVGQAGTSNLYGTVAVDSTSRLEFGAAGSSAAGSLTVDPGQGVLLGGGTIDANVVLNGTMTISYGGFSKIQGFAGAVGSIGGSGTLNVMGGDLVLNAADSAAIALPANPYNIPGTLELMGPLPTGTIGNLTAPFYYTLLRNIIKVDKTVTGIGFAQTTSSQGTLTLTNGAATVGTLALAGSAAGSLFHVDVAPATGIATISVQVAPGAAGTGAANTGKDTYSWTGTSGGTWSTAGNWTDTTTNTSATTVPGSGNAVSIAGDTGPNVYTTVGGNGAAAGIAITGGVLMTGTVAVAGLVSLAGTNNVSPRLALDPGAKLTAGSAQIGGTLQVDHASATVTGTATLTGGALLAFGGSTVQAGALIANGTGNTIAIDANSIFKIGNPAVAVAGALTQQTGATAALTGSIYGSVVTNGTLAVAGGGALFIDLTGTAENDPFSATPVIGGIGVLSLTEGSTLGLGVASTAAILFNGPNATLQLAALPTASITGFAGGDQIVIDKTVTGLAYKQTTTTAATLTLTNGAATVGTLNLAGSFASAATRFHLDVAANGASATISLQSIGMAAAQPALLLGTAATDLLQATANNQTLTGLGGGDTFNGNADTGLDFKDLTANLSHSAIQNFATSDLIDFTDMSAAKASVTYANGVLSATDGTHAATLTLGFLMTPATGSFTFASDGASGTKVYWH